MSGVSRATPTPTLVLAIVALIQVSIGYRVEIAGASPDVLMLVVASIALLTGSVSGAINGFLAGVMLATFAGLPVGPHALVAALVGYTIGRVGEALVTDEHPVPPLVAGVVATVAMHVGRPLVVFLVDPSTGGVGVSWPAVFVSALVASLLAVPVYALVRRVLNAATARQLTPTITRDVRGVAR